MSRKRKTKKNIFKCDSCGRWQGTVYSEASNLERYLLKEAEVRHLSVEEDRLWADVKLFLRLEDM